MSVEMQEWRPRSLATAALVAMAWGLIAASPALSAQSAAPRNEPAPAKAQIAENYGRLPLRFEANQGQTDKAVKFLARGSGYGLFLTGRDAVLTLHKQQGAGKGKTDVVRMQFKSAGAAAEPVGLEQLPGTSNYLLGGDAAQGRTGIPAYARVRYASVYRGIDLVYYGNQQQLEYDFVVAPHADPNLIRMHFDGAGSLKIDEDGNLLIGAPDGEIAFHRPVVYQASDDRDANSARRPVAGRFALLAGNTIGFALGPYEHSKPLVIDPTLVYSTFLGGSTSDSMTAIAVDASGAAYLTGTTASTDYPVTPGVFQSTFSNAFVTKLNASGTAAVYSSFLGGTAASTGGNTSEDIAVDSLGDAYIIGKTYSTSFPVTKGAFQTVNNAATVKGSNAFAAKINPTGTALVYSTYLGGSSSDGAMALAIDSSGNAYIGGYSYSSNFPTTKGAYQTTNNSASDYGWNQFLTKLNPAGTALVYSTYIGGSGDYSEPSNIRVAIDSTGNAYLAGTALSTDFPTTTGAYQTETKASSGHSDITLVKFNSTGTARIYSTYFGGSGNNYGDDIPNGLAVDSGGNAYFSGTTWESNFPVTPNAYQKTSSAVANYKSAAFVTKMNPAGTALVYSTYLGGSGADRGARLAIDSADDVYIAGSAGSTDFPVTSNAYQSTNAAAFNNGAVVFLTEFNPAGTALLYSTYFGGSNSYLDSGNAIALGSGEVYLAGVATGSNFPTTPGAYNRTFNSSYSTTGFVAKFYLGQGAPPLATETTLTSNANPAIAGMNVTFSASVVPTAGTAIPAGNVVFNIDQANAATVTLSSKGWATYTTKTPLALGQHAVLATYQGNATYAASGGNLTETIAPSGPTFSPAGGVYSAAQVVTIADATPSAVLYYTTNGTVPSASSTKYTGPISVNTSETIRAIGILPSASSSVANASYSLVTAPTVLAVPASAIGTPNATLNALASTFGMSGSFYFQYGSSSATLTSSTPSTSLPASPLGGRIGAAPVPIGATITGLKAKTTYYFRAIIRDGSGSTAGTVLSFTTN